MGGFLEWSALNEHILHCSGCQHRGLEPLKGSQDKAGKKKPQLHKIMFIFFQTLLFFLNQWILIGFRVKGKFKG